MQNFVECTSAGAILGTPIAEKLAGKVELITAASMRLSRYSDGAGTQNVRVRRATIESTTGSIPGQGSHVNANYNDSGGGLPVEDSIGQSATKWCFGGNLPGMLNIIQWLMGDGVICIHYGMSQVAHFYGTNGGSSKRPILKVTLTITAPSPTKPAFNTVSVDDGIISADWTTSRDLFEAFDESDLSYELQYAADGENYDESHTHTTAPGDLAEELDIRDWLGLGEGQYHYAPAAKLRIRAVTPLWPDEGGEPYYSEWVESSPITVDLRITPSAPTSFAADSYEKYETESATFTIGRPEECNALNSAGEPMGLTYTVELADGTVLAASEGATAADESVVIDQAIAELPAITASGGDIANEPLYVRITPEEGVSARYDTGETITIRRFRAPHIVMLSVPARVEDAAVVYFRVTDTGYAKTGQNSGQMGTTMYYNISGYGLTAAVTWKPDSLDGQFVVDNGEDGLESDQAYNVEFWLENDPPDDVDARASNIAFGAIEAFTPILVKRVKKSVSGNEAVRSIATNAAVFGSDLNAPVDEGCVVIEKDLTVGRILRTALNRQDNTTNVVIGNQLIQWGWGWIQGDGSSRQLNKAVTFPVEFDDDFVMVICNATSARNNTDPVTPGEFNSSSPATNGKAEMISKSGFTARLTRVSFDGGSTPVFAAATRYGFVWFAIGMKAQEQSA